MKDLYLLYLYYKKRTKPYIDKILSVAISFSIISSFVFITTVIFEYGYLLHQDEKNIIDILYHFTWILFITVSLSHLVLNYKNALQHHGKFGSFVNILLYLTLIPLIWHSSTYPAIQWILDLLGSRIYHTIILSILSVLQIASGIVRLLGNRLNPSLIFSSSFLVIILVGAGLLMLPKATYNGISFIDALFTSTSATCVTGLATIDVSSEFTNIGLFIIMVLIQIGGLGVMTLTCFFAVFYMGNSSIYNQSMMCDMVNSRSLNSLLSTLLSILGFTLIIEGIGAVVIFIDIHNTLGMSFNEEISFSIFHSISAFCNAGFSTLSGNLGNEMLLSGHNFFYITISILVILGGIGFPVLVNLLDKFLYSFNRLWKKITLRTFTVDHKASVFDLNTKIALGMTTVLILFGTVTFALLEWNNTLYNFPLVDKIVHSVFNAVTPRTAGFNSVSMSSFSMQTIMIFIILMVIGGGAQSTAGGIKVNAFAVILINIKSLILGHKSVAIYNREISVDSVRRSNSTLILYMTVIFISLFMLTYFEPNIPFSSLLFEAISALSTVGASLDVTAQLCSNSKIVIIVLMFLGRVGVITVMSSFVWSKKTSKFKYPSGEIIIN